MSIMSDKYSDTWPTRRNWDRKYRYFGQYMRSPKARIKRGRNFVCVSRFYWDYLSRK